MQRNQKRFKHVHLFALLLCAAMPGCGGDAAPTAGGDALGGAATDPSRLVEVELGDFSIVMPLEDHGTSFIEFQIVALTPREKEGQLAEALKSHQRRIHDGVATLIKESEPENLLDPRLGLLKSGLRRVINQTIQQPLVDEVVFSKFAQEVHR